jgi:hypothetical protein
MDNSPKLYATFYTATAPPVVGETVSGQELLLRDALKKIEEQDERIKELENSVYMLERSVYDRED